MNDKLFSKFHYEFNYLLSNFFQSDNYVFFIIPVSPQVSKYFFSEKIICFQNLQECKISVNFLSPTTFCFSLVSLNLFSGLFIYGFKKDVFEHQVPIFWGGRMVAQVFKKEFSSKDDAEKFWAGSMPYDEFDKILLKIRTMIYL